MKTILITDIEGHSVDTDFIFDLSTASVHDCIGCWSCWWKTPGRCTFKDLDEFYHEYVTADKAVFFSTVIKGFISGTMKTLFDRMIPLYLPYTTYTTGESMHVPRYERYPDIEFYYKGDFTTQDGRQIFEEYINRVFYQFHSEHITVKPMAELQLTEGDRR
jgi:multimeric flavodoxin WrbA